ncbi:MAG: DUF501 domain-containing protein [Ilumatobacteraceae bacterium]
MTTTPADRARVAELLGREPRGAFDIVVRDAVGDPVVLRNAPFLDDGTPMPTRYWLIGPDEIRRIGRLESAGGVDAAEAAVPADQLEAAHARYAAERDAEIPAGHEGPRPTGGIGGTRLGVKCLPAHWAWHLAGGDDPVGRWIADRLSSVSAPGVPTIRIGADATTILLADGTVFDIPWGASSLTEQWLADTDPPRPEALTYAFGAVADHLDDLVRERPELLTVETIDFDGATVPTLAAVENGGRADVAHLDLDRDTLEEVFRMIATDRRSDRAFHPGMASEHVDTIVATNCIVLAVLRRLRSASARLSTTGT